MADARKLGGAHELARKPEPVAYSYRTHHAACAIKVDDETVAVVVGVGVLGSHSPKKKGFAPELFI